MKWNLLSWVLLFIVALTLWLAYRMRAVAALLSQSTDATIRIINDSDQRICHVLIL